MWKKYKEFLRKRTDRYLVIGSIVAMLLMLPIIVAGAINIYLVFNQIPENIIIMILIMILSVCYFVVITFNMELVRRCAERRRELEQK